LEEGQEASFGIGQEGKEGFVENKGKGWKKKGTKVILKERNQIILYLEKKQQKVYLIKT
jgi:hypothetical protein